MRGDRPDADLRTLAIVWPLAAAVLIAPQMWPSAWGSDIVVNRLRAKGFAFPFEHLCLPETGHITPLPNTVTTFCPALFHSLLNIFLACGGTPAGTARASRMTWDAIKAHYERVFGPAALAQGRR